MGGEQDEFVLDGVSPLAFAITGRYCIVSDDAELLSAMMQRAATAKTSEPDTLVMLGGFNHEAERENFVRATQLIDGASASANADAVNGEGQSPQFFSHDLASLSHAFAAMQQEEVSAWWKNGALHQTVRYEWKSNPM
jgi:hypothetical protein